jgi:competence protein ComEA
MLTPNCHKVYLVFFSLLVTGVIFFSACTSTRIESSFSEQKTRAAAGPASININTADVLELEKLPQIGRGLATKIVEHRNRYGPFRKPEHLLVIDGISEKRFREIRHLITI